MFLKNNKFGSRWIAGWCQQLADQGPQQPLATGTDVVDELEEPQVQREALLRDPSVGAEPGTQQRPEPFERVDMHLTEAIAVVIAGVLPRRMADRLVAVAPLLESAVDVVLVGVDQTPFGDRLAVDRELQDGGRPLAEDGQDRLIDSSGCRSPCPG